MAVNLTINGVSYSFPNTSDEQWGDNVTDWATAVSQHLLQKSGGTFTLTADVDFGASFGLKSVYYKTRASNPATTGNFRLGNNETIVWRNAANSANLTLKVNASNNLEYEGVTLGGTIPTTQGGTGITSYTTGDTLYASAANTLSKLAIGTTGQALKVVAGVPAWGTLAEVGGGTNQTSYTTGDILYASALNTLSKLAIGTTGHALKVVAGVPAWGVLAEVGGGTNQSTYTLGDMLYASATNTLSKLSGNTAVGYRKALGQTGAAGPVSAAPAWETPSRANVVSKTTTYTATTDDEVINCSGSAFTVTLYAASNNAGRRLWIRKTDSSTSNIITVDGNASETINGALTYKLYVQYEAVCIECDGSNWFVVSRSAPPLSVVAKQSAGSLPTSTTTYVFGTEVTDTHAAYNNATGEFTAPYDGYYDFGVKIVTTTVAVTLNTAHVIYMYVDGSEVLKPGYGTNHNTSNVNITASGAVEGYFLTAGQIVTFRTSWGGGGATTAIADASQNYVTISSRR